MDRPATTRVGATINPNPEKPWRPFTHQRDVPTDGTWFVARSTKPGWAATRVVRYRSKTDRLPTDESGELWPSEPTEWMPLDEFAALAAPKVASEDQAARDRRMYEQGRHDERAGEPEAFV